LETFLDDHPSYSTITRILRLQKFSKESNQKIFSEKSHEKELKSTIISKILKDYPHSSIRQIAMLTGIPRSTVYDIVTQSLGYEVHHLRWISHSFNCQQKNNRVELSKRLLKTVQKARSNSYICFLTGDESWFFFAIRS